jgi:hypothetical protein
MMAKTPISAGAIAQNAKHILRLLAPYLPGMPKANRRPTAEELTGACLMAKAIIDQLTSPREPEE